MKMPDKYVAFTDIAASLNKEVEASYVDSCDCEAEEQELKGYVKGLIRARVIIRDEVPHADIQPAIHSAWVERDIFGAKYKQCRNCNVSVPEYYADMYCSHCGAKMDGKEKEDE